MKYPISIQTFEKIIKDNYVYVDKTDLVYDLVQEHVCFLSRPRRFGKSLLISTLDAYFQGKKELFEGLKIADLEKEWAEYPVFRIDFAVGNYSKEGELENILDKKISDWEKLYGKSEIANSLGLRFAYVITKAEEITGHKVVVLIDEYDKPLLDPLGEEQEIVKLSYAGYKGVEIAKIMGCSRQNVSARQKRIHSFAKRQLWKEMMAD